MTKIKANILFEIKNVLSQRNINHPTCEEIKDVIFDLLCDDDFKISSYLENALLNIYDVVSDFEEIYCFLSPGILSREELIERLK